MSTLGVYIMMSENSHWWPGRLTKAVGLSGQTKAGLVTNLSIRVRHNPEFLWSILVREGN